MANKPLTKSQLVTAMADKNDMTKVQVSKFFDTLHMTAVTEAKKAGEFTLPGFGKLVKANRKARMGRNPQTGEAIKIKASKGVRFKASKTLKDTL